MGEFIFDLQRFATQTISAGKTYALDGVTYTAITDAVLNLDSDNKVSGIASGKVTAVVTGAKNSPTATFGATDGKFNFTASGVDGAFVITGNGLGYMLSSGSLTMSAVEVEGTENVQKLSFTKDSSISFGKDGKAINVVFKEDSAFYRWLTDKNIIYCALDGDSADFDVSLAFNDKEIIGNTLTFGGTMSYSPAQGTFALISYNDDTENTKDSFASFNLSNYKFKMATDGKTVVAGLKVVDDGTISINYPREDYNKTNLTVSRGDTPIFGGNVSISNGSIGFNPVTKAISLANGTKISIAFGNYEVTATADGDAAVSVAMTPAGLSITPVKGDGTLNLTLGSESGSMSVNLEVLSGSFILGENGALTVTKDTELQIDFGGGYVVKFKATDAAGGSLSLGTDGITFTSNSDDGGLELSVTNGGVTRTTSLNMTGTLTYKLDGSISLAKGTVLRNVFEDGNELTITANTDASGSIIFTPQNGLSLTPAAPNSLTLKLIVNNGEFLFDEITGGTSYNSGALTLHDGTTFNGVVTYDANHILRGFSIGTNGGETEIKFSDHKISITPADGASAKMENSAKGHGWTINKGVITLDVTKNPRTYTLTDGSEFVAYRPGLSFLLEKTGNYNLNSISVTTTKDNTQVKLIDYNTVKFGEDVQINRATSISGNDLTVTASAKEGQGSVTVDDDGNVTYDATDGTLKISVPLEDVIGDSLLPSEFTISGGSVTMGAINADATRNISITKGTALSFTKNGMTFDTVVQNDINGRLWMREGHVIYLHSYEEANFDTTITFADKKLFSGMVTLNGALSYNAANGTTGLVDSNTYNVHDSCMQVALGDRTLKLTTNGDTFFAVLDVDDNGKITFDFNNEKYNSMLLTVSTGDKDVLNGALRVTGSIVIDPAAQEISLVKDTVINLTQGDNELEITALDDAGGKLTLTESGIRFAPNAGDGALELNFVSAGRKVTLDITGEFVYGSDGKISLEDGTEINLAWEDGTKLKLTSTGSTGSIGIDPDKGIKITSDDENLNMTLTTPYMSTNISGIKGTIYYNAGVVSFDENSKITATTTLGGQPILTTLETVDGTGHISFSGTTNGIVYSADTGAMKITWSRDDLESTFVVNKGSVQIGHNLFRIAEGSDIATDLKTFVPALYFTTAEAGTYTINGQTIKTSAEGLALTATDDQMVFKTSGDVVEYDGMTFAGNGNVSLKADNVVLGAGVEAKGFGKDKSFMLAEAGNVTADAKVFELTELDTPIKIPMAISVTGAQDGFTFSRTLTKESEAYLDDALSEEKFGNYSSSYIGQVFSEKFIAAGDSSYRIRTDAIGLEEVIGISNGATITGGASLADKPTLSYYNLVTDTTGKFTIGERTYNVSGDSSIALRARFEENAAPYASMVDSLNGTISGDFSGGNFSINGSSALKVIGDTNISIVADESGYEILGLDAGANLQVSAAGNYKVNGTEIAAGASSVIIGTADGKAQLYNPSAILADFMLHKTAAGYPQMAVLAFHPDEENPDAPTNYHSAEKWTTTSTDDLQLSAIHYSPENPTGKWVILVHGYGKKGAAMNAFAEPYLAQGMDVLIVDQRTAGDSEGDWLTMGVAEANDLAIWTQEIAKTNANAQITLHGVSMGAATVMLCAALPETTNVSAMIEDCGYGNIADVFATLLTYYGSSLGVGDVDYYKLFDDVAAVAKTLDGGYDVGDAAPIDSIAAVTVPSLFIHGAADVVIPSTNADALYDKSGAKNKTKLIIEGAGHAKSIELDTEAYLTAVKKLVDSSTKEIGASIDSDADNISLRGTIYNDTINNSGTAVTIQGLSGNDYIVNNVDSSLVAAELANSIDAGEGNDTIYSYHTYNPTLLGGEGDDSIVVERGHKTFANGGTGNDKIIGISKVGGWGMGDYATILGGEGDDYINPIYSGSALIDGGNGNDTIFANGANATIDGGDGNNLIVMTDDEGGVKGKFVVLNGNTTVESFNTGFESDLDPEMGEGTDTIYIDGDPAGVYFKDGVLTFSNSTDSLTLSDVTTTAKVNIYHKRRKVLNKGVFIADNDWYSVSSSDLSVSSGEEVYFVGPSATQNHGVDFSGITQDLNVTIDTAYIDSKDYVPTTMWINGVYSLKGGAGNTTINGSDKDDTIIAGKGKTTIDGGDGKNLIDLTDSSAAQIVLNGNTTVKGFATGFGEGSDTIYIDGDPAGVYFKDGVLTFSNSTDSLTLSDVTTTAKVNIYHKRRSVLNKGVFIADNDWYSVSSSDLSVSSGEEVYFVGPSATQNHGVDFSGITQDLNVTIDTAYIDSKDYVPTTMWINGVYSIRGGAGNTTITGSDKNDTIIAGKGKTTIDGGKGDDYVSLNSAAALVEYRAGDGNDKIVGFNSNSTLSISGSEYSKSKNGNDVIVTVGDEKITLSGAAKLSSLNIEGKQLPVSVEESIAYITNGYVTNYYDYGTPITDQSKVKTLLDGDLNGDMALLLENKSADFSEYSGRKNITLIGGENQNVTFNKEGHNTAIVDENTSGTKNIYLGNGDLVFVEDTGARVNITASKGNDTIVSEGENVFVDLKGGKTDIFASNGKMTINGYDASTNSGFGTNYSDILSAINDGEIYFDKGQMSVGSAVIDFNGLTSVIVNFFNLAGKIQKVGQAAPNETLDLSKETANFILAADKNSKLTAGAGNDSIFAYEGSRVDAGAGNNVIYIEERGENANGVNIVLSAGSTTIKNIHNTFDNGDILEVDPENISYNGTDLIISGENFKATVESPDKDSVSAYVNQLVKDSNGKTWKMAVGGTNTIIDVKADEKLRADYYKAGGVTFENYDGKVQIDLSDGEDAWGSFIGDKAAVFDGVTSVKAGAGDTTLKGSDANETFIAGNGNSSLYGAGGKNLLVGYEGEASLKEGSTTFFVLGVYETAFNTIQNFAFVNDYNYANKSADMIEIDTATNFIRQESIEVIGNDVAFSVENRNNGVTESVLVKNAAITSDNVKDMRFSDGVIAQVSTNDLYFDKFANFYVATGKNATVNVSNDNEYSKVWLDNAAAIENGSDANAIFVGDIRVIDATNSTVTAELAGNDLDNTILAGTGDSSLWGGKGGNDLLVGGESKNMFYYTLGNGNDTITNVNDGDIVELAGVNLENIIGADFTNNALALNFSDGGKLTVNENSKGVNFVVGNQIFYVNDEHNGFVTAK